MSPLEYQIKAIQQSTSECMQTAATQTLSYFDPSVNLADVLRDVPLYVENGEKIGTSPGHLAAYFAKNNYQTTTYIFDTELFDRSWGNLDAHQVVSSLRQRQPHIPANSWLAKYHHILVNGWEQYANAGGAFSFQPLTTKLLRNLLNDGPYLMMVNSTYLNQKPKSRYDQKTDAFEDDSIRGRSTTHAVTCAGYKEDQFLIVDPDPPKETNHHRWIPSDHLLVSIMAAQTESDNLLIALRPKDRT
ncbi:MAG: hypothetical protein JWN01_238 [Patescibacteria group bacterium]|nr:hypothetical protein [Patescibacteria group bacterium]